MNYERLISPYIKDDLEKKIILLSGPRQVGKTTLSKRLFSKMDYLNYDSQEDRSLILKKHWDRGMDLIVLDEIHKMKKWKSWLKGVYDKEGLRPRILVTGSSRMDVAKKMGDSLAGRHFQYQLFPLDLKELKGTDTPSNLYSALTRYSGFPEPFFSAKNSFYVKWKRSHMDLILRQDLIDLEAVRDISSIETMTMLLESRIASSLSYSSLAQDLQRDIKTIQRWITVIENLYLVFRIYPFSKNIARSILKEPKIYFYDYCRVEGDEGKTFENFVALCLKKEVAFLNEAKGIETSLHVLRLKGGIEVDFLVLRKNLPAILIEAKLADDSPSKNFHYFNKYFPECRQIQLVRDLKREKTTPEGIEIRSALDWLSEMDLANF
jgi:uncharacterized protein